MFELPILIRKIRYRASDNRPTMFLLAMYHLISSTKGDFCILHLIPGKGIGMSSAQVDRHERAFVKFLKANYGVGEYVVQRARGGRKGFPVFWRGIIEPDRFVRLKGSISPYLITQSPVKSWHDIDIKRDIV